MRFWPSNTMIGQAAVMNPRDAESSTPPVQVGTDAESH